jgi:hypothetical protein
MKTGCFQRSTNLSANSRAATVVPLPAPTGTMMRTGRCGHASARTWADEATNANKANVKREGQLLWVRMSSPFGTIGRGLHLHS